MDASGTLDVVAVSSVDGSVRVLLNNGGSAPTFSTLLVSQGGLGVPGAAAVAVGDLQRGAGVVDIACVGSESFVTLYLQGFTEVAPSPDPPPAPAFTRTLVPTSLGIARSLVIADVDGVPPLDLVVLGVDGSVAWYQAAVGAAGTQGLVFVEHVLERGAAPGATNVVAAVRSS